MAKGMDDVWTVMGVPMFYKLDADHKPVPATLLEWASGGRQVLAREQVGEREVSTIFVGLHDGRWPYFETAIIGSGTVRIQERYGTYDEAMNGHAAVVARLKKDTT